MTLRNDVDAFGLVLKEHAVSVTAPFPLGRFRSSNLIMYRPGRTLIVLAFGVGGAHTKSVVLIRPLRDAYA
jgi:hypothetical protein